MEHKYDLDTIKDLIIINLHYGNYGIFATPNLVGDPMEVLYDKDGVKLLISNEYKYFEVFGLTEEEFHDLAQYYYGAVDTFRNLMIGDKPIRKLNGYVCPNCYRITFRAEEFCSNCGGRFDWSDVYKRVEV